MSRGLAACIARLATTIQIFHGTCPCASSFVTALLIIRPAGPNAIIDPRCKELSAALQNLSLIMMYSGQYQEALSVRTREWPKSNRRQSSFTLVPFH